MFGQPTTDSSERQGQDACVKSLYIAVGAMMTKYKQHVSWFVVLAIPAIGVIVGCSVLPARGVPAGSLDAFIANPSPSSWRAFEADVRAGHYGPASSPFPQVLEYQDAQLHRDFPNSMTLRGMTPDQYVGLQIKRVDSALKRIQNSNLDDVWRLIRAMGVQDFDEDLVWTAGEIAARISPGKFEELAADIVRLHPERSWIVERTRARWLRR